MKEYKDCLACSESYSEEATENSKYDKLYCVKKQKYVDECSVCDDFI